MLGTSILSLYGFAPSATFKAAFPQQCRSSLWRPTQAVSFKPLKLAYSPARTRFASTSSADLIRTSRSGLSMRTGIAGLGLGLAGLFFTAPEKNTIHCDAASTPGATAPAPTPYNEPLPPPPQSSVNLYELSFGTVCGVCAGVFVKKGAKMVAFFLGGVFVLLQYFGSLSLVRVDWAKMSRRFEDLFYTKDVQGVRHPPNVGSLFRWIVDFLTADFQQRASFVAGFVLGLRIG